MLIFIYLKVSRMQLFFLAFNQPVEMNAPPLCIPIPIYTQTHFDTLVDRLTSAQRRADAGKGLTQIFHCVPS